MACQRVVDVVAGGGDEGEGEDGDHNLDKLETAALGRDAKPAEAAGERVEGVQTREVEAPDEGAADEAEDEANVRMVQPLAKLLGLVAGV